jgi:hypothetical protein
MAVSLGDVTVSVSGSGGAIGPIISSRGPEGVSKGVGYALGEDVKYGHNGERVLEKLAINVDYSGGRTLVPEIRIVGDVGREVYSGRNVSPGRDVYIHKDVSDLASKIISSDLYRN